MKRFPAQHLSEGMYPHPVDAMIYIPVRCIYRCLIGRKDVKHVISDIRQSTLDGSVLSYHHHYRRTISPST